MILTIASCSGLTRPACTAAIATCESPVYTSVPQHVPAAYRRFLEGHFREVFRLKGTPMRIEFRTDANPFAGRRNVLTPRQVKKRQRLVRRVKGGKR